MDHRQVPNDLPGFGEAPLEEFRLLLIAAGLPDLAEWVDSRSVPAIVSVAVRQKEWNAALADWLRRWGHQQREAMEGGLL